MKIYVTSEAAMKLIQWSGRILLVSSVVLLSYCGYVLLDGWVFDHAQTQRLNALLRLANQPPLATTFVSAASGPPIEQDGLIGRIEIPDIGLSVIVAEGVEAPTLQHAAGHIPGTSLPGQTGNVGIAGHRDTFFRPLRNIRTGHLITLTTPDGVYRYRVSSTQIVKPDNVAVLERGPSDTLTLVTCYPFYFIGSAPDRFIVRAELVI